MSRFKRMITSFISNLLIRSEEAKNLAKLFQATDTKRDGVIDREEFKVTMVDQANEFLGGLDAD